MMYATMNETGFGPLLLRNNSFEDETENLYYSDLVNARRVDERRSQSTIQETAGSYGVDLDDCETMPTVNPAEITGQSLAMKMEVDKFNYLQDEGTFDLESFVDEQAAEIPAPIEETQDLIREMEDFLSQYEDQSSDPEFDNLAEQLLSMEQQQTLNSMQTSCPSQLSPGDAAAAENLLDELLKAEPQTEDILATAVKSENLQDSGIVDDSTETSFNTNEGNVIIIIAPPSESGSSSSDSDPEWSPDQVSLAPKRKPGRKPTSRQDLHDGKVAKKTYKTIKDKKERKKIQNVMAARRYRDKKKLEAQEAEDEEQKLLRKNRELRSQLNDIESEMKTMKKLMFELGLFKVVKG